MKEEKEKDRLEKEKEKEKDRLEKEKEKAELLSKIQKLEDDLEEAKGAKNKEDKDKYDQSVNKFFEW